jgi:hypothetical protein
MKELIERLRNAHANSTQGKWQKGQTTHHTVTDTGYKIGEFHHANDAAFVDLAHEVAPALCDALERLTRKDVALPTPYAWIAPKGRAYQLRSSGLANGEQVLDQIFIEPQLLDYGNRRAAAAVLADEALMRECLEALQWEIGGEPCNGQQVITKLKARLGEK